MEFSINPPRRGGISSGAAMDEQVELYQYAATYDITHVVVGHHWISYPNAFFEPWPMIGYLQAQLPSCTVSGFIATPLYEAVDLAEKVATMDILSKGKFVLRA